MTRNHRPASRDSCRACSNWAGSTVATCGSTLAGPRPIPTTFADTRPNWLPSGRTSSWLVPAPQPWRRCCRRAAPCRSCSGWSSTRSAPRHRDLLIPRAARHKFPTLYAGRWFVPGGGLFSYGRYYVARFRREDGCGDRLLKGERPADLPVQSATKYQTVINLKTAKALGLTIPESVLARSDEVLE